MAQNRFSRSDSGTAATNPGSTEESGSGPQPSHGGGTAINLGMVYFTLFRHKWKILVCATAGLVAAAAIYFLHPPPFVSEAKVLIKYVDDKQDSILEDGTRVKSPDMRGETIIRTEVEILTSFNLAEDVARAIGPERLIPSDGGASSLPAASGVVYGGLSVESSPKSSVLLLQFSGQKPDILQPVLDQVIQTYMKHHADAHRSSGVRDDALTQETDQLRAKLNDTEEELRTLMDKAGVISLEDAKKVFAEQIARLQEGIMNAEAELAGAKASLSAMTGTPDTTEETATESTTGLPPIPEETVRVYRQVAGQLSVLYRREQEYLAQFTPETPMVKGIRAQIEEHQNTKERLEREYRGLASLAGSVAAPTAPTVARGAFDPAAEIARIRSIESRVVVMRNQLGVVRSDIAKLGALETSISELQRRRELLAKQYSYFAENLEKKRIDVTLGSVSGISVIQTPSPPRKDLSKVMKIVFGLSIGGVCIGVGLAFAIEMFLDHSVKRPSEIEATIGLPLVLTIPRMKKAARTLNGSGAAMLVGPKGPASGLRGQEPDTRDQPSVAKSITPWSSDHELRTFFDALRDRLIYSFEMRGITRKPKLVAVTSCGADSGVSTVAAGIAASLSETGDGNVLLVDMNPDRKTPQYFHKGDLKVGLDDVLAEDTRDDAMIRENLYMVSQNTAEDRLTWIMPKKFAQMVPKMKASDFDYIIFDMPPVSQISATPQLARYMDQVLMVVESEKTSRDAVKRAGAMLTDAGANVGVVLNKTHTYVPRALDHDALAS